MARLKSVLLVDFDNIFAATGMALVDTLPKWLLWLTDGALSEKGRRRKFVSKRVYWNSQYDVHRDAFQAAGFETFDCRAHAKTKIASGKSSADIVMTMDAIELRHEMRGIDEMVILTTDSDFVPVVNRLQLDGLRVVTAGKETDPTYELYSQHADGVIHIGALKAAFDYERTPRKWYKLRSDPPVIAPLRQQAERRSPLMKKVRDAVRTEKSNGTPEAVLQMRLAADIVMQLGARTPDQPLPRNKVIRALEDMEGFQTKYGNRVKPWLGQKNFKTMMLKLSKENPDIEVTELADKTVRIVCRVRGARGRRGRMVGVPSPLAPPPKRPEPPQETAQQKPPEKTNGKAPEKVTEAAAGKPAEKPAAAETRVDVPAAAD
ncbi:NYN domain-containing protein [Hyphomonas sp.]|uniref:NYN domain-containing protein n=1 Tax=Hyphomonas sp. TaxID=87 RepID=UPI003526D0B0